MVTNNISILPPIDVGIKFTIHITRLRMIDTRA